MILLLAIGRKPGNRSNKLRISKGFNLSAKAEKLNASVVFPVVSGSPASALNEGNGAYNKQTAVSSSMRKYLITGTLELIDFNFDVVPQKSAFLQLLLPYG
jgi:hypothetical protein